MSFLDKIFKDAHQQYLEQVSPTIKEINHLESKFESFSCEALKNKTREFKQQIDQGKALDDLLVEAFALVREAAKRTLKQRHYDVQLIGGIALHQGRIVEMKTGEGKTLAATLAAYLNALTGEGVHVVTVNDYLARRDTVWMGQIYDLLGLRVGCLNHEQAFIYDAEYKKPDEEKDEARDVLGGFRVVEDYLRPCTRSKAYQADIVYGTNNEFGFDYLRDNMARSSEQRVQRRFYYAILDEIDFILIDEARTPLIISAPDRRASKLYQDFVKIISWLKETIDYEIDEERKIVTLTEAGIKKVEKILGIDNIYIQEGIGYLHHLEQALRAQAINPSTGKPLFAKDADYVVKNGKIIIVDEFTGRLMPGRRWSGGLHQAIEAKEGLEIQPESRTLAKVTFQNFFRMYQKLAGMTGTAITSAEEFDKVYGLDVVNIPTNKPMIRKDLPDRIYRTEKGKYQALVREIVERHNNGQPLLIGTRSIEKSESLAGILKREGVPCQVLNAKNHEEEAEIIAQAGRLGAVTVATNMAGRGVDIILGGNPPNSKEAENVRELGGLHVIGTERHEARRIDDQLRGRAGRQGDPGSSQFFLSLEDELLRVFGGERIRALIKKLKFPEDEAIEMNMISKAVEAAQAKIEGLHFDVRKNLLEYDEVLSQHREVFYERRKIILESSKQELCEKVGSLAREHGFSREDLLKKENKVGEGFWEAVRVLFLRIMDFYWMHHLEDMDWLRQSVKLRVYANMDPLIEYKKEAYGFFHEMIQEMEVNLIKTILRLEKVNPGTRVKKKKEVGRNDPCPCGSGKKYKKCCWSKKEKS